MTNLTLFGLALAPLYSAIAEVETNRGDTSANVYQLRQIYVDDVNRIIDMRAARLGIDNRRKRARHFQYEDACVPAHAEYMMAIYWSHYGEQYEKNTGERVTYEVLARIHNGGPVGWKKRETIRYWLRVADAMLEAQR